MALTRKKKKKRKKIEIGSDLVFLCRLHFLLKGDVDFQVIPFELLEIKVKIRQGRATVVMSEG